MSKVRILFVDDEPSVLHGLRRMLRKERNVWDMEFLNSGQDALKRLGEKEFDIIVSDMRMPGMDGAELLSRVARKHPEVVRCVLSGHADEHSCARVSQYTHQFLSKPCDPELLRDTLATVARHRNTIENDALRKVVLQIDTMPSLPTLYTEVVKCCQAPECGVAEVTEVISKDMAMTAKILQLVNSSFFGISKSVPSLRQAALLIGLDSLRSMALSLDVFRALQPEEQPRGFCVDSFWRHCSQVGALAKQIVLLETGDRLLAANALTAGILHDIGKLIVMTKLPNEFQSILAKVREDRSTFYEAESENSGISHGQIGAYLLGLWRLPDCVCRAVSCHHAPQWNGPIEFDLTVVVHAANVLVQEVQPGTSGNARVPGVDMEFLESLGFAGRLEEWRRLRDGAQTKAEA